MLDASMDLTSEDALVVGPMDVDALVGPMDANALMAGSVGVDASMDHVSLDAPMRRIGIDVSVVGSIGVEHRWAP